MELVEPTITYGGTWQDVEADEVDLLANSISSEDGGIAEWEQWRGIAQRGQPGTLMMTRLKPQKTARRSHSARRIAPGI